MSSPTVSDSEDVSQNDENSKNKLNRTLSKLIEDSFIISDDTVLEKLFTHVQKQVEIEGKFHFYV